MRRRPIRLLILLLLLFVSFLPATPSIGAPDSESKDAVELLRTRFDELRQKRDRRLEEIAALEAASKTAVGEDRTALHGQALAFMFEGVRTLEDMWSLIEELESTEADASAERAYLVSILPRMIRGVREQYASQISDYETLKKEQAELDDPAALASLTPVLERKDETILKILEAGIEFAEISASLALPTEAQRTWLEARVKDRARLAMSHVNLATTLRSDVEARKAAGGDPDSVQAAEAAANARLRAALASLKFVVDLMQRFELDDTLYQQLLVASTGEITVEAIDREVVGDLFSAWIKDLRESAAENGGRIAFQSLLFIIIVLAFVTLARFVREVVGRTVEAPHLRFSQLLKRMIVSLSSGLVLLIGILIALSQMGIEVAPMLAGLGIAGFVIGFALQDTLGNFAAGIMILIYRPYDVGDMIDCAGGVFGKVSHMSLVSTTILTIDNKTLIVPNNKIWGDVITNVTAQAIRRVDLEFGISYADDIPHAEAVLLSILEDHPKVLDDPEPIVKVHSLGDSSVNFIVRPWCARDDYWDVHWDVTREVKLRFDREGVSIPFPQRDVHFYATDDAAGAERAGEERMQVDSTPPAAKDEPESDG